MTKKEAKIINMIPDPDQDFPEYMETTEEEAPKKKGKSKAFNRKIETEWVPDIMLWISQGMTLLKVREELQKLHGVTVTEGGISYVVNKMKAQRGQISKGIVRENIGAHIVSDLEGVKQMKQELFSLKDQFKDAGEWPNYFKTVDRIESLSKMIFELSGVNENQVINEAQNAKQDLIEMFQKFKYNNK
jgi:hypothetical protein